MTFYLVAQSELPEERNRRRENAGKSAGETYKATLKQLSPESMVDIVSPADQGSRRFTTDDLTRYDAVFLTGSPMHVYLETVEVDRQLDFMRTVFASGVPSFGSCAGLQVATAAAGGIVRKMPTRMEAGIARRIYTTKCGHDRPLLAGRPPCWDAPAIHGDEVAKLPADATLLASNATTTVQAAEIRFDRGVFWGVQYHPELSLAEIAVALKAQATELVKAGIAEAEADVLSQADQIQKLHGNPVNRAIQWRLGVDRELAEEQLRRREIVNFIAYAPKLRNAKTQG